MDRTSIQPLLATFKAEAQQLYQDRLAALYLFGSYARGEANDESDVDILVVLNDESISPFREIDFLTDLSFNLGLQYDKEISVVPATRRQFDQLASPVYHSIKREGQAL